MKILFIVPNKKLIPSSIIRVMSWQKYLKGKNISNKVINYESTLVIKIENHLSDNKENIKNSIINRYVSKLLIIINYIHKNIVFLKLKTYAKFFDVFFFQWVTVPTKHLNDILNGKTKIVYDYDDAVFLKRPEETEYMVKNSNFVIAGSHFLFEYAKKLNKFTMFLPNAVDIDIFKLTPKKKNRLCIGWIGSKTTTNYLNIVVPALNNLCKSGYVFDLLIAGCAKNFKISGLSPEINIILIPSYNNHDIPTILSKIDIGIMPLYESLWEIGKSAMKAILYMAAAKPVIASKVGESIYLIRNNLTGFLVQNNTEWEIVLMRLLKDQDLRERIGREGRKLIEENYSLKDYFNKIYINILENFTSH